LARLGKGALETREDYDSGWDLVLIDKFGEYCHQQ